MQRKFEIEPSKILQAWAFNYNRKAESKVTFRRKVLCSKSRQATA